MSHLRSTSRDLTTSVRSRLAAKSAMLPSRRRTSCRRTWASCILNVRLMPLLMLMHCLALRVGLMRTHLRRRIAIRNLRKTSRRSCLILKELTSHIISLRSTWTNTVIKTSDREVTKALIKAKEAKTTKTNKVAEAVVNAIKMTAQSPTTGDNSNLKPVKTQALKKQ